MPAKPLRQSRDPVVSLVPAAAVPEQHKRSWFRGDRGQPEHTRNVAGGPLQEERALGDLVASYRFADPPGFLTHQAHLHDSATHDG